MQRTKIHVLFFHHSAFVGVVGVFAPPFSPAKCDIRNKFHGQFEYKNVQINGLMKTYSLNHEMMAPSQRLREYVMTKDAVEIALDVPKDISEYDSVIIEAEFENLDSTLKRVFENNRILFLTNQS